MRAFILFMVIGHAFLGPSVEIESYWEPLQACDGTEGEMTCKYSKWVGITKSNSNTTTDSTSHEAHVDFNLKWGVKAQAGICLFESVKASMEASIGAGKLYYPSQ